MKPLIIPIAIGLLAGLGGGTGFAYMKASQAAAHAPADSTAAHDSTHADSTAHDSTAAGDEHAADSEHAEPTDSTGATAGEELALTPADSLRALELAREMIRAGKADPKATGKADPKAAPAKADAHEPVTTKLADVKPAADHAAPAGGAPTKAPTTTAATVVKDARDAAMHTPLPEQRLAKIFGAMAPKDAAKVMDQMTDTDVRAILAFMGDKQAGAVLAAMPPARVANITRGGAKTPESK